MGAARSSSLRGRAGAAPGEGGTTSELGVGPPPLHPARFGVGGDVTAGTQPPLAPSNPIPAAAATPVLSPRDKPAGGWARAPRAANQRGGRGAGLGGAGGGRAARHAVQPSQRPGQPKSSSSSALRDPRPCPCPCRAASSEAREVRPPPAGFLRRARHPAPAPRILHQHRLPPAPESWSRPEPLAPCGPFPSPIPPPSPWRTMGQVQGCPPFIRSLAGPSGTAPALRPLLRQDSRLGWARVAWGRASAAGGISRHPPSLPGSTPLWRGARELGCGAG